MGIIAESFVFNGESSADHDLLMVSFDDNDDTKVYSKELIKDDPTMYRPSIVYRGCRYSSPIQFKIDVCKPMGEHFTIDEYKALMRWFSADEPKKIYFTNPANPIYANVHFYGQFTDIGRFDHNGEVAGLKMVFETTTPYGFSSDEPITITSETLATQIVQNTSDENKEYYPVVKIKSLDNQIISITNTSDGNRTTTLRMVTDQTIVLDFYSGICEDTTGVFTLDDFNLVWVRLIPGENSLSVIGNCIVTIDCEFPRLVGGY